MSGPRGRRERLWDITALVLIVAGAALYLWTHFTLGSIGNDEIQFSGAPGISVAHVDRLQTIGRIALGVIGAGVLVGLWSYFGHGRRRSAQHP